MSDDDYTYDDNDSKNEPEEKPKSIKKRSSKKRWVDPNNTYFTNPGSSNLRQEESDLEYQSIYADDPESDQFIKPVNQNPINIINNPNAPKLTSSTYFTDFLQQFYKEKKEKVADSSDTISEERETGVVTSYDEQRRYGRIRIDDSLQEIYFDLNNYKDEERPTIRKGYRVSFTIWDTPNGPNAYKIKKIPATLEEIQKKLVEVLNRAAKRKISFLLVGITGDGKSSTVNSLMGRVVAKENPHKAETMEVFPYPTEILGIKIVIYDTPGLCDAPITEGNNEKYLSDIKNKVKQIDCLLFVTSVLENRLLENNDIKDAVRLLTDAFGDELWKKSVIVFTFADLLPKGDPDKIYPVRSEQIREVISDIVDPSIALNIPTVLFSNKDRTRNNVNPWLGDLYTAVLQRISENGCIPFLLATSTRVILQDDKHPKESLKTPSSYDSVASSGYKQPLNSQREAQTLSQGQGSYNEPIILNENQQIDIGVRIFNTPEIKSIIPDLKDFFELLVAGATIGHLVAPGVGPIVGAATAAALVVIEKVGKPAFNKLKHMFGGK